MTWAAKIALVSGSKKWNCSMVGAKSSFSLGGKRVEPYNFSILLFTGLKLCSKRHLIIDY